MDFKTNFVFTLPFLAMIFSGCVSADLKSVDSSSASNGFVLSRCQRLFGLRSNTVTRAEKAWCYLEVKVAELEDQNRNIIKSIVDHRDERNLSTVEKKARKDEFDRYLQIVKETNAKQFCPSEMKQEIEPLTVTARCRSKSFSLDLVCDEVVGAKLVAIKQHASFGECTRP